MISFLITVGKHESNIWSTYLSKHLMRCLSFSTCSHCCFPCLKVKHGVKVCRSKLNFYVESGFTYRFVSVFRMRIKSTKKDQKYKMKLCLVYIKLLTYFIDIRCNQKRKRNEIQCLENYRYWNINVTYSKI